MYALSVVQPYASLLVLGAKRFETRPWHTAYRGPLAIHAGARFPPAARALCLREPFRTALRRAGLPDCERLPLGVVLGTVFLLDCVRVEDLPDVPEAERALGDFRPGRWAWRVSEPAPWPAPVAARGRLGVFQLPVPLSRSGEPSRTGAAGLAAPTPAGTAFHDRAPAAVLLHHTPDQPLLP
jgi:hypothetical protein